MKIDEMKLTKKIHEALINSGINNVDTVKEMSDDELLSVKGITKKGLEEIHKKRKSVTTPKERREYDLKEIRERLHLIPEPTSILSIGDKVRIGNLEDTKVINVFDNGKIYEINYTRVDNNYGNPIRNTDQRMFVTWLDIRKSNNSKESFVKNEELRLNYSQREMSDIFSKVYFFGTNLDPDYQRDYVWELKDKVKLINSIFNNVDIGKFVFVHSDDYSAKYLYEVLDGKQRIRTILDFYEDRFEYKGKKFSDLSFIDKHHFTSYNISIAEIRNVTTEQKLKYFINLNTGGKVMSDEHIEKVKSMLSESLDE